MRDVKTGPRMVLILCLFMSNAVEMGNEKYAVRVYSQ